MPLKNIDLGTLYLRKPLERAYVVNRVKRHFEIMELNNQEVEEAIVQ